MFNGEFIGWKDRSGDEIHCGDKVVITIEEVAEWIDCCPRYETYYVPATVEYNPDFCAFILHPEMGPDWDFREFAPDEIQITI